MLEILQRGGWSAQLVVALGLLVAGLIVAHHFARRTSFMPLILGFGAAMVFVGCLGVSAGLMDVMAAFNVSDVVQAEDQWAAGSRQASFTAFFAFSLGAVLTVAACVVQLLRRRRGGGYVA